MIRKFFGTVALGSLFVGGLAAYVEYQLVAFYWLKVVPNGERA